VGNHPPTGVSEGFLWGGRFGAGPDTSMMEFTSSIEVDSRLIEQDVAVTKAHARTLLEAKLIEHGDLPLIDKALDALLARWSSGELVASPEDEDVHSLVERSLTDELGDLGKRIHAGRSRNDLVATDLRLWCKSAADTAAALVAQLLRTIASLAEEHSATVIPGYTHLQRAQPVSLGFHLLAHGFALARDRTRFLAARESADVSSLGAGALAGSTLGLDPNIAATELGFDSVFDNATDAVADRDFAWDLAYAAAACAVHLSRLGEEIVLWTSSEFGFARLSDEWSTGSSMMPQKRNPDVAELVRGRAAGAIADLTGLLTLLKGLPLAYNRDLQEDKEFVFRAADRINGCLKATDGLLRALEFDRSKMGEAASDGPLWATDVAERLVKSGVPFRKAHEATGAFVRETGEGGVPSNFDVEGVSMKDILMRDVTDAVEARVGPGGPSRASVLRQAARLRALSELT
jgi:argininosuccinate lyase